MEMKGTLEAAIVPLCFSFNDTERFSAEVANVYVDVIATGKMNCRVYRQTA